jgi:hypothetical protein
MCRLEKKAGFRLPTRTIVRIVMRADADFVKAQAGLESRIDLVNGAARSRAAGDIRLVGHDNEQKAALLQAGTGLFHPRKQSHFRERTGRIRSAIADHCHIQDAVTIEEHGATR